MKSAADLKYISKSKLGTKYSYTVISLPTKVEIQ